MENYERRAARRLLKISASSTQRVKSWSLTLANLLQRFCRSNFLRISLSWTSPHVSVSGEVREKLKISMSWLQTYLHFKYSLLQFDVEFLEMTNRSCFNLKGIRVREFCQTTGQFKYLRLVPRYNVTVKLPTPDLLRTVSWAKNPKRYWSSTISQNSKTSLVRHFLAGPRSGVSLYQN